MTSINFLIDIDRKCHVCYVNDLVDIQLDPYQDDIWICQNFSNLVYNMFISCTYHIDN